jgi:hypothetical protein
LSEGTDAAERRLYGDPKPPGVLADLYEIRFVEALEIALADLQRVDFEAGPVIEQFNRLPSKVANGVRIDAETNLGTRLCKQRVGYILPPAGRPWLLTRVCFVGGSRCRAIHDGSSQ